MATVEGDDATAQSEELYALESIFGVEACTVNHAERSCKILVPFDEGTEAGPHMTLQVWLPEDYPSSQSPVAQLSAPHLSEDLASWAVHELEGQFRAGESIVFEWVTWLKEQPELQPPVQAAQELDQLTLEEGRQQEAELDAEEVRQQSVLWQQAKVEAKRKQEIEKRLVHGEPFTERKSTFQAHLAPVSSSEEVEEVMATLLDNSKIQRATHNMMAYRISSGPQTLLQDCDDDGEAAAGGRLLHLLQIVDARDLVVVVSRWYGGVLLGPSRFTHINNAARALLDECGYIAKDTAKGKKKGK